MGFKPLGKVSTSLGLLPHCKCHPFLLHLQIFGGDVIFVMIVIYIMMMMMTMIMIMKVLKRILDEDDYIG